MQAIFTNPFPWEFPPKIMKTSVIHLKRISQHLQAGATPLPLPGWVRGSALLLLAPPEATSASGRGGACAED